MWSVDQKDAYLSMATKKIPQVRMARNHLQIYLPAIWPVQCTKDFHIDAMTSDSIPRSENCDLSGRPADNGKGQGDVTTTGESNPYVTGAAGIHHQYPKALIEQQVTRTSVTAQHLSSVIRKLTAIRLAVLPASVNTCQLQQ